MFLENRVGNFVNSVGEIILKTIQEHNKNKNYKLIPFVNRSSGTFHPD